MRMIPVPAMTASVVGFVVLFHSHADAAEAVVRSASSHNEANAVRIERLGARSFAERSQAMKELRAAGRSSLPLLVQSLQSDDYEIRARASILLEELCIAHDDRADEEIFSPLAEFAGDAASPSQRFAARLLESMRLAREQRTEQELERDGAEVLQSQTRYGFGWTVRIVDQWSGGQHGFAKLERLTPIYWLSLENPQVNDATLVQVAKLPSLRSLYLGGSHVSGRGLTNLASLTQLEYLSLRNVRIDDAALERLPEFPELNSLGLEGTHITDRGLATLSRYPLLQTLWLDRTDISDAGLTKLQSLTKLRMLYLSDTNVSGSGLSALARLPELRFLSLKNTKLTESDVERLSGMPNLETLGLDHTNVTDAHLSKLTNLKSLKTLWLSKTAVSDAGVEAILGFLNLETVYLHGAAVSSEGAAKIRERLPNCHVHR